MNAVPQIPAVSKDSPVKLFYSYSHQDEDLREELVNHLSLLKRQGIISEWHDRMIEAGGEWKQEIDRNLQTAQIILLLVSADFMASDYSYEVEMAEALKRHEAGEAHVVPILLRPVLFEGAPFAKFQMLPTNAKPVTKWENRDEAFENIAKGIRRLIFSLRGTPQTTDAAPDLPVAKADAATTLIRLTRLLDLLEESWSVFLHQQKSIKKLHSSLEARLGAKVPQDVGYDETFFLLYEEMDKEEREMFQFIRVMTTSLFGLNSEMKKWADENGRFELQLPNTKLSTRLFKQLRHLKLHLTLWINRYEDMFLKSDRRSIVYLDDLKIPGKKFPPGIASTVHDLIAYLSKG